jgi:hypothetical protein
VDGTCGVGGVSVLVKSRGYNHIVMASRPYQPKIDRSSSGQTTINHPFPFLALDGWPSVAVHAGLLTAFLITAWITCKCSTLPAREARMEL